MSLQPEKEVKTMQEQNAKSPNNENSQKKSKAKKIDKKNKKSSFSETVADYKAEFKQIVWPSRKEAASKTITVIFTSLFIGAVIFCMDTVFGGAYNFILNLLG